MFEKFRYCFIVYVWTKGQSVKKKLPVFKKIRIRVSKHTLLNRSDHYLTSSHHVTATATQEDIVTKTLFSRKLLGVRKYKCHFWIQRPILHSISFKVNPLKGPFNKHRLIVDLKSMNFKQVVNDTTRPISGTCFDHIYSNFSQRLSSIWIQNIGLADHLPLFVVRKYRKKRNLSRHETLQRAEF